MHDHMVDDEEEYEDEPEGEMAEYEHEEHHVKGCEHCPSKGGHHASHKGLPGHYTSPGHFHHRVKSKGGPHGMKAGMSERMAKYAELKKLRGRGKKRKGGRKHGRKSWKKMGKAGKHGHADDDMALESPFKGKVFKKASEMKAPVHPMVHEEESGDY